MRIHYNAFYYAEASGTTKKNKINDSQVFTSVTRRDRLNKCLFPASSTTPPRQPFPSSLCKKPSDLKWRSWHRTNHLPNIPSHPLRRRVLFDIPLPRSSFLRLNRDPIHSNRFLRGDPPAPLNANFLDTSRFTFTSVSLGWGRNRGRGGERSEPTINLAISSRVTTIFLQIDERWGEGG